MNKRRNQDLLKCILLNKDSFVGNGEYKIHINCSPAMFKTLRIEDNGACLTFTKGIGAPWRHPPLKIEQLINWPYAGFQLILPDVIFTHKVNTSFKRFLYLKETRKEKLLVTPRSLELQTTGNIDHRSCKTIRAKLLKIYFVLICQIVNQMEIFSTHRKEEIAVILETVLNDIEVIKEENLYTELECVYPLNKYDYFRSYDMNPVSLEITKAGIGDINDNVEQGNIMQEIISPEVNFTLKHCTFDDESVESYFPIVNNLFKDIFKRDEMALKKFNEIIEKCIIYSCCLCDVTFEGVSGRYSFEEHVKEHGNENEWTCINCGNKFDACYLSSRNWSHECILTS